MLHLVLPPRLDGCEDDRPPVVTEVCPAASGAHEVLEPELPPGEEPHGQPISQRPKLLKQVEGERGTTGP